MSNLTFDFRYVRQVESKPAATGFEDGNIIFDRTEQKFYQALASTWVPLDFVGDDFTVNKLAFNTAATETLGVGELAWNTDDETVDMHVGDAVTIQLGQEMVYHVINQTGSQIDNGTVVMADGALGASGKIKVVPAIADGSVPAKYIMGVATEDIANGALGYVTAFGKVSGFDTSSYSSGTILYASATSSGSFTDTIPAAPNAKVTVAITLDQKNNGTIFVRPTFGSTFAESQDVTITSASNNDVFRFDSSTSVWVNASVSDVLVGSTISGSFGFADGFGINFSDSQSSGATSSVFDDYEEGEWTPAFALGTSGSATESIQVGYYTKVGNFVTAWGTLRTSSTSSPTGDLTITGLPFVVTSDANSHGCATISIARNWATDMPNLRLQGEVGTSTIDLLKNATNANFTRVQGSDMGATANDNFLRFVLMYRV